MAAVKRTLVLYMLLAACGQAPKSVPETDEKARDSSKNPAFTEELTPVENDPDLPDPPSGRTGVTGKTGTTGVSGTTSATGPTGATGPVLVGTELNAHWIGGACAQASDCSRPGYTNTAQCLTSEFDNGMCTQACKKSATSGAWLCPDTDTSAGSLNTLTRCIDADGAAMCASECDFTASDTGCRPGYACVRRQRYAQPDKIFSICLPEDLQRWPGEDEPQNDIGAACSADRDCGHLACLSLPSGYCTKANCLTTGCPSGSTCARVGNEQTFCVKSCTAANECRESDGYSCDSAGDCWAEPQAITWNPAVGAADCASAWGTAGSGLSVCDVTKDDYVAVRKSARNLALCNKGALVKNFQVGLGFAPVGDKVLRGDGKTPEGVYYVSLRLPSSSYYKAFLLSYPDKADAVRGVQAGLISAAQKQAIDQAQDACGNPPQQTGLGGEIELHGKGGDSDWTLGCIAGDDSTIDEVWAKIDAKDTIVVYP